MQQNFSLYRFITEEEQEIFKQLIGEAFKTEALLVSTLETKTYTEYIFIYNHPTEDTNNLVSFYGKVKKSKELELLEFATAQLTEKMILRNVNDVENLEDFPIKAKVANSIKYDIPVLFNEEQIVLTTPASAVDYKTKSQATYFFDCTNSWFTKSENERWKKDNNGKIIEPKIPTVPFGSFCCVLQKESEYFILTAGHNLGNGKIEKTSTTKGSLYKLIKDENNFVELELTKDYRNTYDAAILKINKITEEGKVVYDLTDATTKNDDITKSIYFYGKAIKFNNNYYPNELDARKKSGVLVGYISKPGVAENFEGGVDYSESNKVTEESFPGRFFQISKSTIGGDSGCVVFTKVDETNNKLLGIYLGDRGDSENIPKKGRCRPYYSLEKSYNIV